MSRHCFYRKLDSYRRFETAFQLGKQRVEVIYGREFGFNLAAVEVFGIFRRDVAGHYLFAKYIFITFYLSTKSCTAMTAVHYTGIGIVVAHSPHHFVQYKRWIGMLALHKCKYRVLVFYIEVANIVHKSLYLIHCVGKQSCTVFGLENFFFH